MDYKKIALASSGPLKAITIVWVFLILIISFIIFIFFDPKGLLYFLTQYRILFNIITVVVAGALFLIWLIVWNILIKAFFKEDLQYLEKNGLKLEKTNGS